MIQAIPELTSEERALARQAEQPSECLLLSAVLRYLHWNKARAGLLGAIAKEPKQLVLADKAEKDILEAAGQPYGPMSVDEEGGDGC